MVCNDEEAKCTRIELFNDDNTEDLRCLLPEQSPTEEQFTLSIDHNSGSPVFVAASKKKAALISVLEWSRVWNIFQTVLAELKHEPASVAKHCDVVLALVSKGHNWRFYDLEF